MRLDSENKKGRIGDWIASVFWYIQVYIELTITYEMCAG